MVCCVRHQPSLCVRHQLSLLNATRSALTRIVSATRSTSCPSSTEATGLPMHVSECLLHSNRQLNSIPRLSGQKYRFDTEIHTFIKHVPSLMFSSVKRALCDDLSAIFPTNQLFRRIGVCHTWATFLASVSAELFDHQSVTTFTNTLFPHW